MIKNKAAIPALGLNIWTILAGEIEWFTNLTNFLVKSHFADFCHFLWGGGTTALDFAAEYTTVE